MHNLFIVCSRNFLNKATTIDTVDYGFVFNLIEATALLCYFKQLDKKYAAEPAIYVQAEQELTDKLSVNYGLRYNMFYRIGEIENIYANNQAVVFNDALQIYESATPIGVKNYGGGEVIANFDNLEPRIAVAYQLSEKQSFKASYNRMSQYLHLISNTISATPLDVWAPSDNFIKPEILDQVALGYFRNFKDNTYSLEAETFISKAKIVSIILMVPI